MIDSIHSQMAQKVYDESEDHYLQMQLQEDHEAAKIFDEVIERMSSPEVLNANEADLARIMNDIKQRVKTSNSPYLRKTFPQLFA